MKPVQIPSFMSIGIELREFKKTGKMFSSNEEEVVL